MGYLRIQQRNDNQKSVSTAFLDDSSITDDNLLGVMPGDVLTLKLEVQEETFNILSTENRPGVTLQQRIYQREGEPVHYDAFVECKVIRREHLVSRDWLSKHEIGFRLSSTTILVEAISDEAEELLISLQKQFDEQLSKTLGL